MVDEWGERMPRSVSLLQTIAVSVGVAIGSGIFRVPATVAGQLHAAGPILSCWVLGGLIALCGTLTVAELAAALPRSGGIFAYLLESYGPLPAFLFGWTELVVVRAAALGAIATVFAEYVGYFLPMSAAQVRYLAAFAIVVIGSINYIGVQRAAAVQSVTTVLKYAVLLALGLLAFTATGGSTGHFAPAWPAGALLSPLASALIPVLWTYDGWADPATMGGEISNPQQNTDRGTGTPNITFGFTSKGKTELRVPGLVVTPGFIDMHAHLDRDTLAALAGIPRAVGAIGISRDSKLLPR